MAVEIENSEEKKKMVAINREEIDKLMKEKARLEDNISSLTEFLCSDGMPGLTGSIFFLT